MQFSSYNYRLLLQNSDNKALKSPQCHKNEPLKPQHTAKTDHQHPDHSRSFATANWRSYLATLPTKSIEQQPADSTTHSIGCVTPLFTFLALIVFVQHCFSLRNSNRRCSTSEQRSSNDPPVPEHTAAERTAEIPNQFEAEERFYQELLVEQRRLRAELARAQNVGAGNDWAPTSTLLGHQSFCDKSGTIRDGWLAKRKCKSVGPVLQDSDETIDTTIVATKQTDEPISSYPSSYVCVN